MAHERRRPLSRHVSAELRDDEAAAEWLSRRGGPDDRATEELTSMLDILLAVRTISLGHAFSLLWQAPAGSRVMRRRRTTGGTIGLWVVDSARIYWRRSILLPALYQLAMGSAAAMVVRSADAGAWTMLFIGVACGPLAGARFYALPPALAAIALDPALWWLDLLCLGSAVAAFHSLDLTGRVVGHAWWAKGSVFGFVPLRARLALLARRRWSLFATAVDLAVNGHAANAGPFLTEVRAGAVPPACKPLLTMAGAWEQLLREDPSGALLTAREATHEARRGGGGVLGWCLADLSRIQQINGDDESASASRDEALALLRGRSCRRYARRLLLEIGERRLTTEPLSELLREIHQMRLVALRTCDQSLLRVTEMWLVRLMLRVGNTTGAGAALRAVAHGEDARAGVHDSPEEAARHRLQAAFALVEEERTRDHGRRDAMAALALVDARTRPLAAVAARLALARAQELDGDEDAALAQAVHSLVAVHEARYSVGEARGRILWERMQLSVYATALRLAAQRQGDEASALVAEVMETARGEVLPRRVDDAELGRHLALTDAMSATDLTGTAEVPLGEPSEAGTETEGHGAPRSSARDTAALFTLGLSPVRRPPAISVGGARRLPGDRIRDGVFELDRALLAVAGRCWYWSAVTVLDRYYWAVRSPEGEWFHGWCAMDAASDAGCAEAELREALPLPKEGESPEKVRVRIERGALGPGLGHVSQDPSPDPELALLSRVSAAFLPPPLAEGLGRHTGPDPVSVVVSLPAGLSHVPVAALPLAPGLDRRVVDVARVLHAPGWAVIDHCLARLPARTARPGAPVPLRLAVLSPDAADGTASALEPPGAALHTVRGPVTKSQLSYAFQTLDETDGLLYLAGHIDTVPGNPYLSGLRVAPEADGIAARVSMADMLHVPNGRTPAEDAAASPPFPVPTRVIAVGCGSLGLQPPVYEGADRTSVSEWLGFGSALLLAGADHVVCTLYTVHPSAQLNSAVRMLADRMSQGLPPADALREMQLTHLERWRRTRAGRPFVWQSFAYSGVGG